MDITDNFVDEAMEGAEPATFMPEEHFTTYIRPVMIGDGARGYAVCTEDGVQLAVFSSPEAAFYSARQYNLTPHRLQ